MTPRALHLVVDGAGRTRADALQALEPTLGWSSTLVSGEAPRAGGSLEVACRSAALAFASACDSTGDVHAADLVVAHGWAAAPAAERLAASKGAAALAWAAPPPSSGPLAELAGWAAEWLDGVKLDCEAAEPTADELRDAYQAAQARRQSREAPPPEDPARLYDLAVRPEGLAPELVEYLLLRTQRFVLQKGGPQAEWRATCSRSHVTLLSAKTDSAGDLVDDAIAAGCLPLVLDGEPDDLRAVAVQEASLPDALARWLTDPAARRARLTLAQESLVARVRAGTAKRVPRPVSRPLRLVLNHGGLVASELGSSLSPLGWELRPLLGAGRDPLPGADLLIVLPYGDPRGALDAVRRARRSGVPAAFWNVEDPRYYHDPELGPLVQAAAQEATLSFSTTAQLGAESRGKGVEVRYLPNYGRGYFWVGTPLEEGQRTIDVLFLGSVTPERQEFLAAYRAALGQGIRVVSRDDVREPEVLRDLVASARLGLSVGTMTDAVTAGGPLRGEGLTERLFDYPLAGTPVLSDQRAHLAETFRAGEEVFVFQDVLSAAAETRALLGDPRRRTAVAARAREKVLRQHLGRHRALAIVDALAAVPGAPGVLALAAVAARERLAGVAGAPHGARP